MATVFRWAAGEISPPPPIWANLLLGRRRSPLKPTFLARGNLSSAGLRQSAGARSENYVWTMRELIETMAESCKMGPNRDGRIDPRLGLPCRAVLLTPAGDGVGAARLE